MLQFFSGGSGASSFTTAPTAGHPTLQVGTGLFGGGAAPNYQGNSAIGVNMAAGYSNSLISLQIAGISLFSVDQFGGIANSSNIASTGQVNATAFKSSGGAGFTTGFQVPAIFTSPGAANSVLVARGSALQTSDIFQVQDSTPTNQFGVANIGTGAAPIWVLRVAPVANTASMAQAHVGGASTGKAIQVVDNAGTTIGWLQLLA